MQISAKGRFKKKSGMTTTNHNTEKPVPDSIKEWNWGACFLNGIWGLGNKTYIALLAFVPIINIPMMIILGLKGNEMSWKNKEWDSLEHFKSTQQTWNKAGLVVFAIYSIAVLIEFWTIISG